MAAVKVDDARAWFYAALALAAAYPANVGWQGDLSSSFTKLGDVAVTTGELEEARTWFEKALAVSAALANTDSANADWQRRLSISYCRLGDVAAMAGKLEEAKDWFEKARINYDQLQRAGLFVGDIEFAQFGPSLAARRRLLQSRVDGEPDPPGSSENAVSIRPTW